MLKWLSTYNEWLGLYNAAIITTIFGAFCAAFVVILCWERLVKDFGPLGGMMASGIIVGTFWVMNHKLPGFGIHPEMLQGKDGTLQFGLIHQGLRGGAPWIDMAWAIAMGLWISSLAGSEPGKRISLVKESAPRLLAVAIGGIIGGGITGLVGCTGAQLFGWTDMATKALGK